MADAPLNYRNPVRIDVHTIDCEIEHPTHGWVPFTARDDDVEQHGRDMFAVLDEEV